MPGGLGEEGTRKEGKGKDNAGEVVMWGPGQREELRFPQVGRAGVWVEGGDAHGEVGTETIGEF